MSDTLFKVHMSDMVVIVLVAINILCGTNDANLHPRIIEGLKLSNTPDHIMVKQYRQHM